jgi:hypothetical protein
VEEISRAVLTRCPGSWLVGPVREPVPIELLYIIQRGCALNPADRYPDVAVLLADLALAEAGQFQVRCPLTLTKRMSRETSRMVDRRPWLAFYAMLTLVVGGLGLLASAAGFALLSLALALGALLG